MTKAEWWAPLAMVGCALCAGCVGEYDWEPTEPPPPPAPDAGIGGPDQPPPTVAEVAPPPISGGTLALSPDGRQVAAADPDRDRLWIVSVVDGRVEAEVALERDDEPGRVTHDGEDGYFVALRGGGLAHVAKNEVGAWERRARMALCPAPRGLDLDETRGRVLVACAGGELIAVDIETYERSRLETELPPDLRDVVVTDEHLYVSVFRKAEIWVLDPETMETVAVRTPPSGEGFSPRVAWRMVPLGDGVALVHQLHTATPLGFGASAITPYYGGSGDCFASVVSSAITTLQPLSYTRTSFQLQTSASTSTGGDAIVLPVDIAVRGGQVAVASAGATAGSVAAVGELWEDWSSGPCDHDLCEEEVAPATIRVAFPSFCGSRSREAEAPGGGQAVAVALSDTPEYGQTVLVFQTRAPDNIVVHDFATDVQVRVALPGRDDSDTGHELFHMNAGGQIACASCHPEGGDDAHVWHFDVGRRRTQDLRGGVLSTAPFHWSGDVAEFDHLMDEVFTGRMAGPILDYPYAAAVGRWLDRQPRPPSAYVADREAASRGAELFHDPEVGCVECHDGPRLTNNATVDVGTGAPFQVPSLLGVGTRSPLLHDGCAETILEHLEGACADGPEQHGNTSELTPGERADLAAYVRTL